MAVREQLLARTFVELADTLVDDFDIVEVSQLLVERCLELFDAAAAGVLLSAPDGSLQVVASSSERLRVIEVFELQAREGPCLDSFLFGRPVADQDLSLANSRWSRFAPVAVEAGYRSVYAAPVRLRQQVIGALNLFRSDVGSLDAPDAVVAQALADVAAVAILQQRALHDAQLLSSQLQTALDSRVLIEQAKGMVAERAHLSVTDAFNHIRRYARNHNQRLTSLCQAIVDGSIELPGFLAPPPG